ncbi:MAG: hypothetical protein NW205_06295 [Hyphomicrobiaceae bacterium]|nr:hypothetical protein [Hyphomicrobiaceae bacterium]
MAERGSRSDRNIEKRKRKAKRTLARPAYASTPGNSAAGRRRARKQALLRAGRAAPATA